MKSLPPMGGKVRPCNHSGMAITVYSPLPIITFRRRYFFVFGMEQMITYPTRINLRSIIPYMEVW